MKKRMMSFLLAVALLAGLLAGCGEKTDDPAQPQQGGGETAEASTVTEYAYKAEYLDLGVDASYQLNYIAAYCVADNQLFFSGSGITGKEIYTDEITGEPVIDEATGEPMEIDSYDYILFRYDLDTGETARLEDYHTVEIPEGLNGNVSISAMAAGTDGTLWTVESAYTYYYDLPEDFNAESDDAWNYYMPGETIHTLRQVDASGKELKSVDLSMVGDSYPQEILVDQAGNLYLNTYEKIFLLDSEGTLLAELPNESWMGLNQISAEEIGVTNYDAAAGGFVFQPIDPETKDYGESFTLEADASCVFPGIGQYQYLFEKNGDTVYGYDPETETSEKLFSWLDCNVSSDTLDGFTILADGRILALSRDYSQTPVTFELICLEQVDASTLPQKQELTLACMYLSQGIRSAVINFNKTHDDIRITVQDYSDYNTAEDYNAGLTKLNTEILSGAAPDIFCTSDLPLDQYAAKGLLTDLWPLIDSDPELSRDDLMTHLFDVLSIDGKLYQITDSFAIQTAVGNADVIGDRTGWTLDELLEVMETLPEDATIFGDKDTKDSILSSCVNRSIDRFINWEEKSCSFDSQEFIDLLNFANSFPKEFDWDNYDSELAESAYSRFQSNRQLLVQAYISSFEYMALPVAEVGGNPCFVGYPSANGDGNCFRINEGLAISTTCQNVDAAWEFARVLLTEEHQSSLFWNFPTNRHAFEAVVEEQMTPEYWTDPVTGEQEEISKGGIGTDGLTVTIYAMTQEEYDKFMALYESCGGVYTTNTTVSNIIAEEAAAFFDGQKTVEETVKLIQDRVGLYVMEQG